MRMVKLAVILGVLFLAGIGVAGAQEIAKHINNNTRWLCYYGEDRRVLGVKDYDLLILESESIGRIRPADKGNRRCIGYMSIGEAENGRWFFPAIADQSWVLDPNPDWPESYRVDSRSLEWQDLLLFQVAQSILDQGYDGLFLDNVDNGEILIEEDPERFAGADQATIDLIRKLRERYPDATIVANNGLEVVPLAAPYLDGMMYEGVRSTWKAPEGDEETDADGFAYGDIDPEYREWLLPRLERVKAAGVPILALDYTYINDQDKVEKLYQECRQDGTIPYVSIRSLDWFPGIESLPPLDD
ncbi:MAG: endo alpha-1,4 polygalactosaminidase [Planctomycetota bacterium]|jgi:uncharacterized protein (TIGR01370 family)|nr:endo alpha-1,4 polygalactosaminidase [Planctomycetota bacterium]